MEEKDEKYDYRWENDGWWIDYMEGELKPAVKESLDLLLSHSKTDRLILENYELLRDLVKVSENGPDQIPLPDMEMIHQQIMSRLDESLKSEEPQEDSADRKPIYRHPSAT